MSAANNALKDLVAAAASRRLKTEEEQRQSEARAQQEAMEPLRQSREAYEMMMKVELRRGLGPEVYEALDGVFEVVNQTTPKTLSGCMVFTFEGRSYVLEREDQNRYRLRRFSGTSLCLLDITETSKTEQFLLALADDAA